MTYEKMINDFLARQPARRCAVNERTMTATEIKHAIRAESLDFRLPQSTAHLPSVATA